MRNHLFEKYINVSTKYFYFVYKYVTIFFLYNIYFYIKNRIIRFVYYQFNLYIFFQIKDNKTKRKYNTLRINILNKWNSFIHSKQWRFTLWIMEIYLVFFNYMYINCQ